MRPIIITYERMDFFKMENIRTEILKLLQNDDMNRTQLSQTLEKPRSTIYDNLVVLEIDKVIPKNRNGNTVVLL